MLWSVMRRRQVTIRRTVHIRDPFCCNTYKIRRKWQNKHKTDGCLSKYKLLATKGCYLWILVVHSFPQFTYLTLCCGSGPHLVTLPSAPGNQWQEVVGFYLGLVWVYLLDSVLRVSPSPLGYCPLRMRWHWPPEYRRGLGFTLALSDGSASCPLTMLGHSLDTTHRNSAWSSLP